jgi:trimethylamine--corrinoid protein Co-methyltransferase
LLDQDEIERIHSKSLDMLSEVGIQFNSKEALNILVEGGCDPDWDDLSVRIPAHVVEQTLDTLPSQFLLAARDPQKDIICGDGNLYFTSSAQSPWYRDLETRQRRPATSQDLIQCAYLINALDEVLYQGID